MPETCPLDHLTVLSGIRGCACGGGDQGGLWVPSGPPPGVRKGSLTPPPPTMLRHCRPSPAPSRHPPSSSLGKASPLVPRGRSPRTVALGYPGQSQCERPSPAQGGGTGPWTHQQDDGEEAVEHVAGVGQIPGQPQCEHLQQHLRQVVQDEDAVENLKGARRCPAFSPSASPTSPWPFGLKPLLPPRVPLSPRPSLCRPPR